MSIFHHAILIVSDSWRDVQIQIYVFIDNAEHVYDEQNKWLIYVKLEPRFQSLEAS